MISFWWVLGALVVGFVGGIAFDRFMSRSTYDTVAKRIAADERARKKAQ